MSFSINTKDLVLEPRGKGWIVKTRFKNLGRYDIGAITPFIKGTWVEEGFYTDLCSGPKKARAKYNLDNPQYSLSWITHDYNYAYKSTTRAQADEILYNNLINAGMPTNHIDVVRDFLVKWGWIAWCRHRILAFFRVKGHS